MRIPPSVGQQIGVALAAARANERVAIDLTKATVLATKASAHLAQTQLNAAFVDAQQACDLLSGPSLEAPSLSPDARRAANEARVQLLSAMTCIRDNTRSVAAELLQAAFEPLLAGATAASAEALTQRTLADELQAPYLGRDAVA